MREFRTLRSMSGERKRSDGSQSEPQATAPLLDSTPELILHYVDAHEYCPPQPFLDAILACPPMRSTAYLKQLLAKGPPGFTKHGPPMLLSG